MLLDSSCISSVCFLVLVKDIFFSSSCGSRQGDILSFLLSVIVIEALRRMISVVVSGVLLSGIFMGFKTDIFTFCLLMIL